MKITIIAYGSRGDVQPILALAKGLQRAGHRVRMVTGSNFGAWVESHGVEAAAVGPDVREMMRSADGKLWVDRGTNPFRQLPVMRRLAAATYPEMMVRAWEATRDADAIVSTATSDMFAASIAEKLDVPIVAACLGPAFVPTRSGAASYVAPFPSRESALNALVGKLFVEGAFYKLIPKLIDRFRRETLGLPPESISRYNAGARLRPTLLGYSARVVPQPPDWPSTFHTTGYWFLDEGDEWEAPAELVRFLDGGDPPVCIGFGSMTGSDPGGLDRIVLDAVARSGRRAILLSGWSDEGAAHPPTNVLRLEAAPHDWLLPRTSAVVHHGGAGTTAAALRAGVPMVVVPHLGDQPFWGRRVNALGVAPKPIARPKLTASSLAEAIRVAAADAEMRRKAAELGAAIRAEDGIGVAVGLAEGYLLGRA
jgi:sterol 3beta-glucosyltransferase